MDYSSTVRKESESLPGVWFEVRRPSLGRRIEMSGRIRELSGRMDFAEAGTSFADKLDASELALRIERIYVEWGICSLHGLAIDGEPATVSAAIESGPESLLHEMANAVRRECGLSEDERKN
jgi:hypothetical protein